MKFIKLCILAIAFLYAQTAMATKPFGLDIGNATLDDIKKSHKGKVTGVSRWTDGPIYTLDVEAIEFSGLLEALAIFNEDKLLIGLGLQFRKDRFDAINKMFAEDLELQTSNIPFVGDKYVAYKDNDITVELRSPHMSFQMDVFYETSEMRALYEAKKAANKLREAEQDKQSLLGSND